MIKNYKDILENCNHGVCTFSATDKLSLQISSIPDGYGVYKICANTPEGEILYIGRSGTLEKDGTYKEQNLRERINNKQCGKKRQIFFKEILDSDPSLEQLVIEWFIIDEKKVLPAYVEACLMQEYFEKKGKLPCINNSF